MLNPVNSILRSVTRRVDEPYNILSFVSHERFEPNLCLTQNTFYSLSQCKDCPSRIWQTQYAPIPPNYHIIYDGKIPNHVSFDLAIVHNQFVHIPYLQSLGIQLPIINVFHTIPTPGWSKQSTEHYMKMFNYCTHHTFISEFNKNAWFFNTGSVIHHGLDSEFFKPDRSKLKETILSVCNDFIGRDWALGFSLWKEISSKVPCRVIGNTPGLSKPTNSIEEVLNEYQSSLIYLNTSLHSPIPMSLLEAMSCGLCPISTNTCMIPDIIQHGENGFIFSPKKPQNFISKIYEMIENPEEAQRIGDNARRTIIEKFSLDKFVLKWRDLIDRTIRH